MRDNKGPKMLVSIDTVAPFRICYNLCSVAPTSWGPRGSSLEPPPSIWAMGLMQYISPFNNCQTWQYYYPQISSATATMEDHQLIFLFKYEWHCRPIFDQLRLRKIIKFIATRCQATGCSLSTCLLNFQWSTLNKSTSMYALVTDIQLTIFTSPRINRTRAVKNNRY